MAENTPLIRPGADQSTILRISPNARLEFTFNQGAANLSKEGQDLVFTFPDGGKLVLEGFYDSFSDNAQAPVLIVEGVELMGEDFLASLGDPDLMPASGPAGAVVMVGGGVYEDALLYGVQGVSRLEKLTFDGAAPELRGVDGVESMGALVFGSPSGELDEPSSPTVPAGSLAPPPVEPPEPPFVPPYQPSYNEYVARGVFYNSGLEVDLLSVDYGAGTAKKAGSLPGEVSFEFYDAKGNSIAAPCAAEFDTKTGRIAFGALEKGIYYCVITDDAGNKYSMQLVSDLDGSFDSHAQDAATPPLGDKLWHGEWHGGNISYPEQYNVISSDLDDTLSFTGDMWYADINTGAGNDSLTTTGGVYSSTIDMGDGNDSLSIKTSAQNNTWGVWDSAIDMGAGNDTISIEASAASGSAYGVADATIRMGDGADSLNIATNNGNGDAWSVCGSTIDMGAGNDSISIMATATNSYALGVAYSSISMGDGADSLNIEANAKNGSAYGVYGNSTISMGDGNDSISINAKANNGYAYGVAAASSILMDDGNGSISIAASGDAAYGVSGNSIIDMGDGNDSISITAEALKGNVYGVTGASSINMGAGNDTISINVKAAQEAHGLSEFSSILMGDGGNSLGIVANSGSGSTFGMFFSNIDTGAGNDTISIDVIHTGVDIGQGAGGVGMRDGVINTGAGNDRLSIDVKSNSYAFGMEEFAYGSAINMGDGNDTLSINVTAATYGHGVDGYASKINMGTGNDSLSIDVNCNTGAAYGVSRGSTIDMGVGDDSLSITAASNSGNAYGLGSNTLYGIKSAIDMGAGDDHVTISAASNSGDAYSVYNAAIDMGAGDDFLLLANGRVSGAILYGGANENIIQANENNSIAHLGDILGLGGDLGHDIADGINTIFNTNKNIISGFESLLVDLTDGHADNMNLDALLACVEQMRQGGANNVQSLVVMGDAGLDSLNLSGMKAEQEHVTIKGVDGLFDHYLIHDNKDEMLDLYVQQQIITSTG